VALFGFAGLSLQADALILDPRLPPSWRSFGIRIHWRSRVVHVDIEQGSNSLTETLEAGEPMTLIVKGQRHALRTGETFRIICPASIAASRVLRSANVSGSSQATDHPSTSETPGSTQPWSDQGVAVLLA
jgi:hypothetical protein